MEARSEQWLEPFVSRLREAGPQVLELGCGPGDDAMYLAERGFRVAGIDRLPREVARWRDARLRLMRGDVRHLPVRRERFDVVLASLSMHYLPWAETVAAFAGAGECLRDDGVLLFRVNASDDVNHGAGQGTEIEPGFFLMPEEMSGGWDRRKRFFTEEDVRRVVPPGFAIEHLAHRTIDRWELPKQVWECLARREE